MCRELLKKFKYWVLALGNQSKIIREVNGSTETRPKQTSPKRPN